MADFDQVLNMIDDFHAQVSDTLMDLRRVVADLAIASENKKSARSLFSGNVVYLFGLGPQEPKDVISCDVINDPEESD